MAQSIDEVEDLTRFADESFDTEDVDLFEFTGVDNSPLTRLKSIILSLDWEISDDILEELDEEIVNLQKMWEGDKVAQVYLQGIEKIGNYLSAEGAYAHVNAMKLLLTLFYNFEKIISSPNIQGDEISALLKTDIRKFKVLQYQIGQQAPSPVTKDTTLQTPKKAIPPVEDEIEEDDILADINASILELEWEVTKDGLDQFNTQAQELHQQLADNKPALVLVNGLQALGAYIQEQKVNAHPDAFSLLHSFFDGLKLLLNSKHMTEEKRQEILVDRISRINVLKEIIAGAAAANVTSEEQLDKVDQALDFEKQQENVIAVPSPTEAPEDIAEGVEDLFASPVASETDDDLDLDFDLDQLEEVDTDGADIVIEDDMVATLSSDNYPADILEPGAIRAVSDVVADDFIKDELKSHSGVTSLDDNHTDDFSDFDLETDALSTEELDDELELLLGTDETDALTSDTDLDIDSFDDFEINIEDDVIDDSTLNEVDSGLAEIEELVLDDQTEHITEDSSSDQLGDESTAELEGQIDSLFGSADEEPEEDSLAEPDFDSIVPALDDTDDEESGFREEIAADGIEEDPSVDLEGRLDSFFGLSEEDPDIEEQASPAEAVDHEFNITDDDNVIAALSDADDESGFQIDEVVSELDEDPSGDIQDKLNSFFGSSEEDDKFSATGAVANESTPELKSHDGIDEKLDTIFQGAAATAAVSLGAIAAKFSKQPSSLELQEVVEVVAEKKNANPSAPQTVILTLIETATEMLTKAGALADGSATIIQELAQDMEDADNPATMIAAVERFTSWQKHLFDKALQQKVVTPSSKTGTAEIDDEIAAKVTENFSQLRETLLNEFAEIRKELKKE